MDLWIILRLVAGAIGLIAAAIALATWPRQGSRTGAYYDPVGYGSGSRRGTRDPIPFPVRPVVTGGGAVLALACFYPWIAAFVSAHWRLVLFIPGLALMGVSGYLLITQHGWRAKGAATVGVLMGAGLSWPFVFDRADALVEGFFAGIEGGWLSWLSQVTPFAWSRLGLIVVWIAMTSVIAIRTGWRDDLVPGRTSGKYRLKDGREAYRGAESPSEYETRRVFRLPVALVGGSLVLLVALLVFGHTPAAQSRFSQWGMMGPTPTASPTRVPTSTPTKAPLPTATHTPTAEPTVTRTPAPTATIEPTATRTAAPTATVATVPTLPATADDCRERLLGSAPARDGVGDLVIVSFCEETTGSADDDLQFRVDWQFSTEEGTKSYSAVVGLLERASFISGNRSLDVYLIPGTPLQSDGSVTVLDLDGRSISIVQEVR
jgi:hypothetical protein